MSWMLAMVLMSPSDMARIYNIPTSAECERVKVFVEKNWARVKSATCIQQSVTRQ
jgi:hypothetical protein